MRTSPPEVSASKWSRISLAVGLALLGWLGWEVGTALPSGYVMHVISNMLGATTQISGFLLIALALAISGQRIRLKAQCQGGAQWRQRT